MGFGTAELMPDADHPGCWTLIVEGVAQSYVDLDDPRHLKYSYVRRVASVVDTIARAARPLRVLHLGGGALTIARYVAVTRPGSPQLVVERDGDLDALVRRMLPLPAGAEVQTIVGDARETIEAMSGERFDLIITDAYDGAQMPARVASLEFTRVVDGILEPGGTYVVNVADLPPALFTRIQSAALREVFPDLCAIGEPGMFRGRRYGNIVLVAGTSLPVARLARIAARDELRARVLHKDDLDQFIGGVAPMRDG
jgi:predicted O-methyltransferase YrrM